MDPILMIFLKYVLMPLLLIMGMIIMSVVKKSKSVLNKKKLIIFVLLTGLFIAIPIVFLGFINEDIFYPWGLIFTHLYYILFGFLLVQFTRLDWFESIGFNKDNIWSFVLSIFVAIIIGVWLHYIIFDLLNVLHYKLLISLSALWVIVPLFLLISEEYYTKIPTKVFKLWFPEKTTDYLFWETMDIRRLKEVKIKLRKNPNDEIYAGISAKIPANITIGQWFNRFVEDHDVKFPDTPIEMGNEEDEMYGWVFYKQKLLPIFYSPIDFDENPEEIKLKDNAVIIARRIIQTYDN